MESCVTCGEECDVDDLDLDGNCPDCQYELVECVCCEEEFEEDELDGGLSM